jgi:type VI secretion system secreted protein Hcp
VAHGDMLLHLAGITGETQDAEHKGCMDVDSWSWGMQSPSDMVTGSPIGRAKVNNLKVVKRVDKSSPTLIQYLKQNTVMKKGRLLVRKAGGNPFVYYEINLENVRLTELTTSSEKEELVETLSLSFARATFKYTPQNAQGGPASGTNEYTVDAYDEEK